MFNLRLDCHQLFSQNKGNFGQKTAHDSKMDARF